MDSKYKLYPSSAIPTTGVTTAGFADSCPRYYWANSVQPQERGEIHALYTAAGVIAEERALHKARSLDRPFKRELPVSHIIDNNWTISGRADFVLDDPLEVWEIKSTLSRWKFDNVIRGNVIDPKHIAQLVTYMTILKAAVGVLSTSYLHFNRKLTAVEIETKELKISLGDADSISIDNEPWIYTVRDVLSYYRVMMTAVIDPSLPPKTLNPMACKTCPWLLACDTAASKQDFLERFRESGVNPVKLELNPIIEKHDIRLKKSEENTDSMYINNTKERV